MWAQLPLYGKSSAWLLERCLCVISVTLSGHAFATMISIYLSEVKKFFNMWNDIELLTNDDTGSGRLNICSRQECGTALYQEDTLVKITSSEKVLLNPKLYACNSSDGCIIVADRSVSLLDSICQSFQMHIQFDTEVDVVGLCQKGQFLVVGERSGNLHLIHVPSKQTLLTNVLVQKSENEKTYLNLIIEKDNADGAIDKMDMITAKKLQGMIKTAYISTKDYHTLGCLNFVIGYSMNNILLIIGGKGDCVLSKWEVDPSKNLVSVQSFADSSMIKDAVQFQVIDNLLFVLDKENILSMWDVYSLTLIWDWPLVHIEEFLLTTESDSSSVIRQGIASLKLIILTVPVNKQVTLLRSPEGPVSVLVLRSLTEALPENRLSRLLHKHKFTEAENFAVQFGLDVELVYKVKASAILEKLASSSIGSYGQTVWLDLVDEAKENLHKIQDNHFVVNYCINTPWLTYETTQEMLNYAKIRVLRAQARLTTFYGAFGPEKFRFPLKIFFSFYVGLSTWCLLVHSYFYSLPPPPEQVVGKEQSSTPVPNMTTEADFESSFDVKMLEDLLNTICATIPIKELCLWFKNVVIPFVRRVVPKGQNILAKWLEQGARNLELTDKVNWPENGLQMAEVFFTSKNPGELGLASSWRWIPLKCGDCEEVHRLKKLVNDLQELVDLYRKYSCKLALCDFEKENASTIVFRMFDKVLAPELIPSILEKFIKPYIREHNLQQDELLLRYIKDLLERCCTRSTSVFETAWEAKAIAVIGCISDTDLIFDAVLQIMHGAVVPWSAAVEQLVKQHLEMKHVKVKLLQESSRLMEMKKLLRGYGIRDTNLLKDKQMIMRLVKYILKQDTPTSLEDALNIVAAYMLPSVEVYILRMVDLIDRDRGEESLNLLKSLPLAEAEKVAERLSIWARLVLQKEADNSEEIYLPRCLHCGKLTADALPSTPLALLILVEYRSRWESTQRLIYRVYTIATPAGLIAAHRGELKENPLKEDECKANLKMFETLASLQEDFGIFISVKDYGNHLLMSQLLEEHIKAYESIQSMAKSRKMQATNSKDDSKTKNRSTESRLYRLALLLQRTEQELGAKLALRSLDAGKIEEALKICRDLYEHHYNEQTGKLLFLACQKLCHMLGADVPMITPKGLNFPAVINEMACQAATICSPDLLLDSLELCKYTLAAKEIYGQCQIENYGFIAKAASFGADKDPYEEWTYDDFFSEDGIVLDPQMALPVAYETISSLVPVADNKMYPLDSLHDGKMLADAKSFLIAMKQKSTSVIVAAVLALLHKVFNCRLIDHNLALGYCTILPKDDMFENLWNVINNTRHNYNKILAVALVGAQLASHYGEAGERQKFEELITDAEWGIQFGKLGISFQTVFRQPSVRKKELIRTLVQNPNVDTDLILKYCRTFMLDSDAALQLCIETLLLQSANANQVEGDSAGDTVKQPHSTLLAKSVKIIPLLKSTKDLVISLSGILHKLDPYDYETIENVLRVIQRADENSTSIQLNQVSLDTLYMSAARHVFEKKLKPKVFELTKAGCSSVINKETTKTVQTIQSYLLSIVNPEWAVAIAHKIAQELPTGPDQIQALKFCLYLAEKWLTNTTTKDESHEKAEILLKKLRMQYKRSATETVLITHKLSTAEHLKLTGKPANLIALLYEHSSINQRIQNPASRDYPDIHAAAKEIAEINNLDMNKIWDKLLEKWLCPNIPTDEPIGVNQLTFAQRSRALKCLIYLADADTVESLFKKPIEKVKYFLQCFIYLAEFETLNIPYTYESFHRSPKEGMIKGLWKNHSHEPTAARLVTELSLEYKVYDPQLWSGLLQKLLGFNMIPNFSRAWRSVILAPFLAASCPPSPKQLEACCECFVVLLKCPVLADLDILGIARQYAQLDLTAFALGCLLLIPQTAKREQQIQGFLSSCNPETVLQQVDEHMNTGEVASFASQIRCLILDNIINEKQYERFLKTKYFLLLKLQVMNTHRVKELVDYLATKSCMDDAAALIIEYQKRCGNPILADRSSCDILKMFLSGPE
ncbi:Kinetochore-associated protein 1 [Chelonia mydas]|uniref:Kinetochore-associated protein 1 n=1 Tax=Chelonia mydas TaxID=8469 RepID=M7C935_CHEMY|nr:Kinetochore-associated protein 1 [Chelonia mydas]